MDPVLTWSSACDAVMVLPAGSDTPSTRALMALTSSEKKSTLGRWMRTILGSVGLTSMVAAPVMWNSASTSPVVPPTSVEAAGMSVVPESVSPSRSKSPADQAWSPPPL